MHKRYTSGFTIVELLVVIVVIAILATIAIVSYSWVTRDARHTAMAQEAQEIVKTLNLYQTKFGKLPDGIQESERGFCLSDNVAACNENYNVKTPMSSTTFDELKKVGLSKKPAMPPYSKIFRYGPGNSYNMKTPIIYANDANISALIMFEGATSCPAGVEKTDSSIWPTPSTQNGITCSIE